jgi:hypothetical protein
MRSIEFEKKSGGKIRKFNNPDMELRILIDEVSLELKKIFPKLKAPCRVFQSKEDIRCYQYYKFVLLLDIKKALLSGNVIIMCLALSILNPKFMSLIPKILRIYFAPVIDDKGQEIKYRKNRLKAGFKTSEELLNILFMMPLKIFNRGGFSQLFVDDLVLYSESKPWIDFFHLILKIYFRIFNFEFHKIERYDLKSHPSKCGERLGLLFGFNKSGELVTKVRSRTLRKYEARIKRSKSLVQIANILHGEVNPPSYPLYSAFNKEIWTDQIQKKQFFARCTRILKSRFPEIRKLSKLELSNYLWGHSYSSTPVLEGDLWAGTIGSPSAPYHLSNGQNMKIIKCSNRPPVINNIEKEQKL